MGGVSVRVEVLKSWLLLPGALLMVMAKDEVLKSCLSGVVGGIYW